MDKTHSHALIGAQKPYSLFLSPPPGSIRKKEQHYDNWLIHLHVKSYQNFHRSLNITPALFYEIQQRAHVERVKSSSQLRSDTRTQVPHMKLQFV